MPKPPVYTPFPAHPLDATLARCTSSPPSRRISPPFIPLPLRSYVRLRLAPSPSHRSPPLSLHKVATCSRLSRSYSSSSLFPTIPSASHSGFLVPTKSPSHPPSSTPLSSTLRASLFHATRVFPRLSSSHRRNPRLFLSIALALPRSRESRCRRSARQSAATGVANSLLATSAPLGRSRAPAGGIRQYAPRCLAGKLYVVI